MTVACGRELGTVMCFILKIILKNVATIDLLETDEKYGVQEWLDYNGDNANAKLNVESNSGHIYASWKLSLLDCFGHYHLKLVFLHWDNKHKYKLCIFGTQINKIPPIWAFQYPTQEPEVKCHCTDIDLSLPNCGHSKHFQSFFIDGTIMSLFTLQYSILIRMTTEVVRVAGQHFPVYNPSLLVLLSNTAEDEACMTRLHQPLSQLRAT